MDFASFLQVIARRWKLVAIGLVVTVVAAFVVMQTMKPTYEAAASVLLYSPASAAGASAEPEPTTTIAGSQNPLYGMDLGVVTDVMAQRMADPAVVEQLLARDGGGTWEVAENTETRSPLLIVTVSAPTSGEAVGTMKNVLAEIDEQLGVVQRQIEVPASDRLITTQIVREDTVAAAKNGSRARALAAVLLLGIIGSFSLPFVADGLEAASRRRREDRTSPPEGVGWAAPPLKSDSTGTDG